MVPTAAAEAATDSAAYKDRVHAMWQQRSASYDKRGSGSGNSLHVPMCKQLVSLADITPGAHVLDLCCGTGTVAFLAATAAGPKGRVVGVDISEGMVQQARDKLEDAAAPGNIEFLVHDVESADFSDSSFDFVLCSSGVAYMQDKHAAAACFRRWLKPGGILAFNSPQSPMNALTEVITRKAADMFGADFPDIGASWGSKHIIQQVLAGAGFSDVQVTSSSEVVVYERETPEAYADRLFDMMCAFPAAPFHLQLSEQQVAQLRAEYTPEAVELARGLQRGDDIVVPLTMLWAVARA